MTVIKINEVRLINEGDQNGAPFGRKYQTDIHLIRNGVPFDIFSLITMHVKTNESQIYLSQRIISFHLT